MAGLPDPVYILKKNLAQVCCLLLNQDNENELLYVGTEEGLVHIWDLKIKRELKSVKVSDKACLAIARYKDNLITQEKGFGLKYWRVVGLEWHFLNAVETDYNGFCKTLVWKEQVYCPCDNGVIKVFQGDDVSTIRCDDQSNRGEVMCMKFLNHRHGLLVAYECGILSLWVFTDSNPKIKFEMKFEDTPICVDVCELSKEGVLGTSGDSLKKFSIENDIISETRSTLLKNPGVACVSIRNDGKLLVAGCWDGRIRYFSMKHLTLLVVLDHHCEGAIQCVMFSEKVLSSYSADILFAAGCDGRISLWDLYTRRKICSK